MPVMHPHEKAATIFNPWGWVQLVIGLFLLVAISVPVATGEQPLRPLVFLIVGIFPAMGALLIWIARGLRAGKESARTVGRVTAAIMLLGVPIGTLLGAYCLYLLRDPS